MVRKSKDSTKREEDKMNDYRACGLYVRVSTDRQALEGESLEEQEQRLRDFCKQRNWNVVKVYCEEGRSAKDTNRPKFKELLKDVESGIINTVIVKKLDRLSRSIIDFERIYNFLESHNVDLSLFMKTLIQLLQWVERLSGLLWSLPSLRGNRPLKGHWMF